MLTRFFKRKPYRGGPHFERLSSHSFDLAGTALEFTVPASDFVMKEPPRMLNFPFQNAGWFDAHCKRRSLRDELSVFCEIWNYFPTGGRRMVNLLAMGTNEPVGVFCFNVKLGRVEKGQHLDLGDPASLENYIKWEYGQYYQSTREEAARRWKHGQPDQSASDRQMFESSMETYIKPLPVFDIPSFGGAVWTHYQVKQGWAVATDYYCAPLSETYYLKIELERRFEGTDGDKTILEPDMQRTADWILQHVKVTRPAGGAGPLALPQA